METSTCFVAMPIGEEGTTAYEDFLAIFGVISDAVEAHGISCERIDQEATTGNITKGIVKKLAESDLVIADLSDLNPNVFYELGVRHALRRSGTILIIDRDRTSRLPFDINQYKVIFYEGSLAGSRRLANELKTSVQSWIESREAPRVDSPVHDWYPALPANLVAIEDGEFDDSLRLENAALRTQVEEMRKKLSSEDPKAVVESSTIDRLRKLQRAAVAGEMPVSIISTATVAVQNSDLEGFFAAVIAFLTSPYDKTSRQFQRLGMLAQAVGQPSVRLDIFREAADEFAADQEIQDMFWSASVTSADPVVRGDSAKRLAERVGIDLETMEFSGRTLTDSEVLLLSYLAEYYNDSGKPEVGLQMLDSILDVMTSPRLAQYHARQLAAVSRNQEAMDEYIAACSSLGATESSFEWFGDFLHNNGFHLEAASLYLLLALNDLQDGDHLIKIADEFAFALYQPSALISPDEFTQLPEGRVPIPADIGRATLIQCIGQAVMLPDLSLSARDRLERVQKRAQIDVEEIRAETVPLSIDDRVKWIGDVYRRLGSRLISRADVLAMIS